ncbi:MAG: hypothetical protein ACTSQZ_00835 [Candidatus Thorarchaeota archaeon]
MKKINTIFLVALLTVSMFATASFVSAQTSDPLVHVSWNVVDEISEFDNEAEQSQWIFGPQPEVWVGYTDNLTSISENNFQVEVDTDLLVNITIPKSFLGEGNDLDTVQFWGNTQHPRSPFFILEHNITADTWRALCLKYEPGSQEPSVGDFMEIDYINSDYEELPGAYKVVFAISFTEAVIAGVFWTGMQAIDTEGRPVSPSWLARLNTGDFATPPIGLSVAVNPDSFSLPDYYYASIVDEEDNLLHFAGINDTFKVRLQATTEIGEVLIPFAILTYDDDYKKMTNITLPGDGTNIEYHMRNYTTEWTTVEWGLYPTMFLKHNATDTYVLGGYYNITWDWVGDIEGYGVWLPTYNVVENSTIDLSKYFVVNATYTTPFDGGSGVMWGGYFTNNTDMSPDQYYGGTINPEMGLCKVNDLDGLPISPRPEIDNKQTMKLAFRTGFVEAYVLDEAGNIADSAIQGQDLNLTIIVHAPIDEINGTYTYFVSNIPFRVNTTLTNITFSAEAQGGASNATHSWHDTVTFSMLLDFITNTSIETTTYTRSIYEIGVGLVDTIESVVQQWHVDSFDINVGSEETVLKVQFRFDVNAPSMVLGRAKILVGQVQNLRCQHPNGTWMGPIWLLGDLPNYYGNLTTWTNITKLTDISGDTLWSPRHLRLGHADIWVPPVWTVTEDGAIDLDGNTYTTDDQYFVKRTGYWHDNGTMTVEGMVVGVGFDPSPGDNGDEFVSQSWMGVVNLDIMFEANESFYWYKADDVSIVSPAEMAEIQNTMWANQTSGIPNAGYLYTAWMTENRTLDLTSVTGLDDNTWHNTWFAWGTTQAFNVAVSESSRTVAAFQAKYAGLLLFNDDPNGGAIGAPDFSIIDGQVVTSEVTHVVLIDSIDSVELRRPLGATNDTGSVIIDPETEITFGISILDVNVTIYPVQIEHSDGLRGPWSFRESYEGALGLNSTNFDYWITHATLDEMAFDITFNVDMVEYDPEDEERWNHAISFKVDQKFGDWVLQDFDQSALDGRGLAVNFFGILGTATRTQYQAGETPVTDTNSASLNASYYEFGAQNSPFANVSMGGLPYTYGGDGHSTVFTSGSSTAPIGAFSLMYESESGGTVTDWQVDASMLFMTAGYTNWGGHEIICDPVFVSYSSAHQTPMSTTTAPTTTPTIPPSDGDIGTLVLVGGTIAVVVILCVLARRRD